MIFKAPFGSSVVKIRLSQTASILSKPLYRCRICLRILSVGDDVDISMLAIFDLLVICICISVSTIAFAPFSPWIMKKRWCHVTADFQAGEGENLVGRLSK